MITALRPMRSDSEPNTTNNGVPMTSAAAISRFAASGSTLSVCVKEERVELARVPDDGLSRGGAEEREQHDPQVAPLGKRLPERRARMRALGLHRLEHRRFVQLQPDIHRYGEQHDRQKERNAPAPGLERIAERRAANEDHEQAQEETQRGGGLDPARVQAALGQSGACSATYTAAPPYSPPSARPCSRRRVTRMIGAATPIVA